MATILCNIPTARYSGTPFNVLGSKLAASIGGKSLRFSVGINSGKLDTTPDTSDLQKAIEAADANGHRTLQLLTGYSPAGLGHIRYLPDEATWDDCAAEHTAFWQFADKLCKQYGIDLILEIINEWDGKVGGAFDAVRNEFVWQTLKLAPGSVPYQHFRYIAAMITKGDTCGRKLCMHQIGSGGSNQYATNKSWLYRDGTTKGNDAAAAIIKKVRDSGGFFAYNTYPNKNYMTSVKAMTTRWNTVTVPNTGKAYMASPMAAAGIGWKLGEGGVMRGWVKDTDLGTFTQGFLDNDKTYGRSHTVFAINGSDDNMDWVLFDKLGKPTRGTIRL